MFSNVEQTNGQVINNRDKLSKIESVNMKQAVVQALIKTSR